MKHRDLIPIYIIGVTILGLFLLTILHSHGFLAIISGNDRSITINEVRVDYKAAFGHTQYACSEGGDVNTLDHSIDGQSLSIDASAPNTRSQSCAQYSVEATSTVVFDPGLYQRMVIHRETSITCNANRPYARTSVNELTTTKSLTTDGTTTINSDDIIITNTGTSITIETTEGRTITSNTTQPIPITMTTSGGNNAASRMNGCTLHLGINQIETTPNTSTNNPTNANNITSESLALFLIIASGIIGISYWLNKH